MAKYEIGDKVLATVKEKTKTNYHFYGGIQCGDLCDCETKIISPSFNIEGVVSIRRKRLEEMSRLCRQKTARIIDWIG